MKSAPVLRQVERRILLLRGQNVILDFDLAELYGVETRALKQAVRRNLGRFPADFMFKLTASETETLVSQTVIPTRGKLGGAVPMAFTEEGVAMLSSVLRSRRAVQVNIAIMRAFVRLREMLMSNADLACKLLALEGKYDAQYGVRGRRWIDCIGRMVMWPSGREIASQFKNVFDAIRELMEGPPQPPKRQIGFHSQEK